MEKQGELISVIIPVYNTARYLPQCLDSVLASTYRNLEIICVDDASPDESPEILDRYAEKDQRIVVIHCEQNGGQAAARNRALDIARGAYCAFADSDAYGSDTLFERLYEQLIRDGSDVAVCGYLEIDETSGEQTEEILKTDSSPFTEKEWWGQYRHKHTVYMNCLWNKLYKTDCFQGKRFVPGVIYEDTNLQHYLLQDKKISVIQEALYCYRRRAGSTTKKKHSEKSFSRVQSLIDRAEYFAGKGWNEAKVPALQDAVKFLYHVIYNSDMDRKKAKETGKAYREKMGSMLSVRDWMAIGQKAQCLMILYIPDLYHALRSFGR